MAHLIPNWVPVADMPDEWKRTGKLLFWVPGGGWYESSYLLHEVDNPYDRPVTHISADTICGPDEEPQR
jgi:acetyl esterase/lipase